jgi:DNA-binding CsgD family transcriptional regulator
MGVVMAEKRGFTHRQRQVVSLIAAGCTNPEIAEYLGLSPRTAKAHCDVLRHKLGVRSRRQIPVAYLLATGDDPLGSSSVRGEVYGGTSPSAVPEFTVRGP